MLRILILTLFFANFIFGADIANGVNRSITTFAFDSTGSQVAIGFTNGKIEIRDAESHAMLHTFRASQNTVSDVVWVANDQKLVTLTADGNLTLFDSTTGIEDLKISDINTTFVPIAQVSAVGGDWLVYITAFGRVTAYQISIDQHVYITDYPSGIASAKVSFDNTKIASIGFVENVSSHNLTVLDTVSQQSKDISPTGTQLSWSLSNNELYVYSFWKDAIDILDVVTGQVTNSIDLESETEVVDVIVNASDGRLAVLTSTERILIVDPNDYSVVQAIDDLNYRSDSKIVWLPASNSLAYIDNDSRIESYEVNALVTSTGK